ncbi:hypothetical protein HYQ46_005814 [Verticillium longisporum]|nr:hypothetical protein HYQ46_005814 [Verticillium longisporum]
MAATTKVSALVAAATGCIPEEPRTPSIAPSLTFSEESEDQEEQLPVEPLRRRPHHRRVYRPIDRTVLRWRLLYEGRREEGRR